jgi:hypothetical protein
VEIKMFKVIKNIFSTSQFDLEPENEIILKEYVKKDLPLGSWTTYQIQEMCNLHDHEPVHKIYRYLDKNCNNLKLTKEDCGCSSENQLWTKDVL